MTWDEENRLMGINDSGRIHQYTYDAGGERVIKSSGDSQHISVNGQTAATIVHIDDYTGYVSPYFVISKGKFTKHYFEGAGRIVSKLGNGAFAQPLGITAGGVNYTQRTAAEQKALDNYVRSLGVPPGPPTQQGLYATPEFTGDPYPTEVLKPVEENQEPPEGWPRNPVFNAAGDVPGPPVQFGSAVEPATVQAAEGFTGIGLPENDIFYFHPDHLGSTSYISTRNGSISQHVEYIAFGEILFEEHSSSFSSPYLFNGKELDRETNLSYYGARYLDMKTSLWLNVDPLALYNPEKEYEFYFDGDHNGGIYNSKNLNSYGYCYQNPIRYVDPNGKQTDVIEPGVTVARELTKSYVTPTGNLVLEGTSNSAKVAKAGSGGTFFGVIIALLTDYMSPNFGGKTNEGDWIKQRAIDEKLRVKDHDIKEKSIEETGIKRISGYQKFGKCVEFAKGFQKAYGGTKYEINRQGTGLSVYLNGQDVGLSTTGIYQFIEKKIGGKDYIFDNMNPKGVPKGDYINGLGGFDSRAGKFISGQELYNSAKEVK